MSPSIFYWWLTGRIPTRGRYAPTHYRPVNAAGSVFLGYLVQATRDVTPGSRPVVPGLTPPGGADE